MPPFQQHHLHPRSHASAQSPIKKDRARSPLSYQSEADDERSPSPSRSSMGPISLDGSTELPPPNYPGEDTRPTSRKELLGFYVYGWAAEVFVICGLGAFIPIALESLARESATAVLASDHSKPCKAEAIDAALKGGHVQHGTQCVFKVLGAEINTASFAVSIEFKPPVISATKGAVIDVYLLNQRPSPGTTRRNHVGRCGSWPVSQDSIAHLRVCWSDRHDAFLTCHACRVSFRQSVGNHRQRLLRSKFCAAQFVPTIAGEASSGSCRTRH